MGDKDPHKVTYDGIEYKVIKEGLAEILERHEKTTDISTKDKPAKGSVFYNPIQQFNRDLSVLAIRVFAEDWTLLRKLKGESVHSPLATKKRKRTNEADEDRLEPSKKPRNTSDGTAATEVNSAQRASSPDASHSIPGEVEGTKEDIVKKEATGVPKEQPKEPFRIFDALSATGLRALRYSREIDQVTSVTANDLSSSAVDAIKLHVKHNELAGKVYPIVGDAIFHMNHVSSSPNPVLPDGTRGRYHVIDLDPYGTAAPFLDAAVQSIRDGGLLCVTCTDSAVFASHGYLEKTFSQYGGLPIKGPHSHEGGIRLILHAIATSAARYGWAIEPLLSLSVDFYVRVFVRLRRSPLEVKLLGGKTIEVFGCDHGCGSWSIQTLVRAHTFQNKKGEQTYKFTAGQVTGAGEYCQCCGFKTHLAGPMWGGPLHNPYFIQRMLDALPSLDKNTYGTIPRMEGMLITARDEILAPKSTSGDDAESDRASTSTVTPANKPIPRLPPEDRDLYPFFIMPGALSKVLHCTSPSTAAFRSALIKLNYRVTRSHAKSGSIRTDAPWSVIWEVMREWVRQRAPLKEDAIKKGTAGAGIMRNDRSKHELITLRQKALNILRLGDDVTEVQGKLQALLWQLEHKDQAAQVSKTESITVEQSDEVSSKAAKDEQYGQLPSTSDLDIVFDEELGKEREEKKVVRYQVNPRMNWGPQMRARGQ